MLLGKLHLNFHNPLPPREAWAFDHELMITLPGMRPQQLKDAPFFPGDDPATFLANGFHSIRGLAFLSWVQLVGFVFGSFESQRPAYLFVQQETTGGLLLPFRTITALKDAFLLL
jgi:hypothetical protein